MHAGLHAQRQIRWRGASNTIKLVCDGNSITAGTQDGAESVGGVPGWLKRNQAPFSSQGYANVAIGGQNTTAMINNATDVNNAYDPSKTCVLFAQDITNEAGVTDARGCVDKLFEYVAARRAARDWDAVVLATCGPVWVGDHLSAGYQADYNAELDEANALLRAEWRGAGVDALIETRAPDGPFDPARWPNYLRATFFDTTPVNGYSNHQVHTDETVNHVRIHYSVTGIVALAPIFAATLLRLRAR